MRGVFKNNLVFLTLGERSHSMEDFQRQINEKSSYWHCLLPFKYIFYNCFYLFATWRKWNYFFIGEVPPYTCALTLANWKMKGFFDFVLTKISVFEKAPKSHFQNTKLLVQKLFGLLKVYWRNYFTVTLLFLLYLKSLDFDWLSGKATVFNALLRIPCVELSEQIPRIP